MTRMDRVSVRSSFRDAQTSGGPALPFGLVASLKWRTVANRFTSPPGVKAFQALSVENTVLGAEPCPVGGAWLGLVQ